LRLLPMAVRLAAEARRRGSCMRRLLTMVHSALLARDRPPGRATGRRRPSLVQLALAAEQQACVDLIRRRGSKGLQRGSFLALRVHPTRVIPRRLARRTVKSCRCAGCWWSGRSAR
jgi:hypothetical protein